MKSSVSGHWMSTYSHRRASESILFNYLTDSAPPRTRSTQLKCRSERDHHALGAATRGGRQTFRTETSQARANYHPGSILQRARQGAAPVCGRCRVISPWRPVTEPTQHGGSGRPGFNPTPPAQVGGARGGACPGRSLSRTHGDPTDVSPRAAPWASGCSEPARHNGGPGGHSDAGAQPTWGDPLSLLRTQLKGSPHWSLEGRRRAPQGRPCGGHVLLRDEPPSLKDGVSMGAGLSEQVTWRQKAQPT